MSKSVIPVGNLDNNTIQQLKYAAFFADEAIADVEIQGNELIVFHEADDAAIKNKIDRLIGRFIENDVSMKENIIFENNIKVPYSNNIINELKERKIIRELELGIFTFREPFTTILSFFDDTFVSVIGKHFKAKQEYYPVIIHADTLNKTNHFVSFPEHIEFVTHLREDLDIIDGFAEEIHTHGGWNEAVELDMNRQFRRPSHVINPATCYHCYEALQGETLEGDGIVVTAISKAHRFESKNHSAFGRLLDFTMREVIFVGTPAFVKENRIKSIELLIGLFEKWQLACRVENANDPFFTNDFKVKASFQRNQDLKYEFRMKVPYLDKTIAVSSSNFHGNTFGKAFDITAVKRPAMTGCLAFGLERWVFAFLAQYGLDEKMWPEALKADFEAWRKANA